MQSLHGRYRYARVRVALLWESAGVSLAFVTLPPFLETWLETWRPAGDLGFSGLQDFYDMLRYTFSIIFIFMIYPGDLET